MGNRLKRAQKKLKERQEEWDKLPPKDKQERKRPGSMKVKR